MIQEVENYLEKYPVEIKERFKEIRRIIMEDTCIKAEEKLWAKLPSYYVGEKFVRIIPFKDHLNIEAKAITEHIDQLNNYKITPKGMLQINLKQDVPVEELKKIFNKTFK